MPYKDANLVDHDLVNKMGITLCDIKVTGMSLLGHDVRAVGRIKQTIQCVHKGRVQGTIHLEAKVVRDLYTVLGADCIASARTYSMLMSRKPPDPPDEDLEEEDTKKPMIKLGGVDKDNNVENDDVEVKGDQDDKNATKTDNNNKNDERKMNQKLRKKKMKQKLKRKLKLHSVMKISRRITSALLHTSLICSGKVSQNQLEVSNYRLIPMVIMLALKRRSITPRLRRSIRGNTNLKPYGL